MGRMEEGRLPKKILFGEMKGKRRWRDEGEEEMERCNCHTPQGHRDG